MVARASYRRVDARRVVAWQGCAASECVCTKFEVVLTSQELCSATLDFCILNSLQPLISWFVCLNIQKFPLVVRVAANCNDVCRRTKEAVFQSESGKSVALSLAPS